MMAFYLLAGLFVSAWVWSHGWAQGWKDHAKKINRYG
jgi:hypothetical protein